MYYACTRELLELTFIEGYCGGQQIEFLLLRKIRKVIFDPIFYNTRLQQKKMACSLQAMPRSLVNEVP